MKSAWDRLDRVMSSAPKDAQAARVTGKGEHYNGHVEYNNHEHHEFMPPIKPVSELQGSAVDVAHEMVGKRSGRLTVLGLALDQGGGKATRKTPARWVVRCDCGDFEFRTAKAIKSPFNKNDMCRKCKQLEINKKRYARDGGRDWGEFVPQLRADKEGEAS